MANSIDVIDGTSGQINLPSLISALPKAPSMDVSVRDKGIQIGRGRAVREIHLRGNGLEDLISVPADEPSSQLVKRVAQGVSRLEGGVIYEKSGFMPDGRTLHLAVDAFVVAKSDNVAVTLDEMFLEAQENER